MRAKTLAELRRAMSWAPALTLLTLGFLAVRVVTSPRRSSVVLNLTVDRIVVTLGDWQQSVGLFSSGDKQQVLVSGFSSIDFPSTTTESVKHASAMSSSSSFSMMPAAVRELPHSPGVLVDIRWSDQDPRNAYVYLASTQEIRLATVGVSHVACLYCIVVPKPFTSDAPVWNASLQGVQAVLTPGSSGVSLTLAPKAGVSLHEERIPLQDHSKIAFLRESAGPRFSSIIAKGTIFFEDTGTSIEIPAAEFVELDNIFGAAVNSIRIDRGIRLSLGARVDAVRVGATQHQLIDRTPTNLSTFLTRPDTTTLIALLGLAVTATTSIISFFKREQPK